MSYFFNPYMMGYNANRFRGVHRLDFGGIPFVRTSSVTTDTTNSEVIYVLARACSDDCQIKVFCS